MTDKSVPVVAEVRRAPIELVPIQRRLSLALSDGPKFVRWELLQEDIPALLAEVARLTAERDEAELVKVGIAGQLLGLQARLRGLEQQWYQANQLGDRARAVELARLLTTPEEPK